MVKTMSQFLFILSRSDNIERCHPPRKTRAGKTRSLVLHEVCDTVRTVYFGLRSYAILCLHLMNNFRKHTLAIDVCAAASSRPEICVEFVLFLSRTRLRVGPGWGVNAGANLCLNFQSQADSPEAGADS